MKITFWGALFLIGLLVLALVVVWRNSLSHPGRRDQSGSY